MSSVCFLVVLSHYWQVELKESITGKMHSDGKKRFWILNWFCYIVYAFWADTVFSQTFMVFYCFCLCLSFLLLYAIYLKTIGLHCFHRTYNWICLKNSVHSCLFYWLSNWNRKENFFNCISFAFDFCNHVNESHYLKIWSSFYQLMLF